MWTVDKRIFLPNLEGREYPTLFHLGVVMGVSEAAANRCGEI